MSDADLHFVYPSRCAPVHKKIDILKVLLNITIYIKIIIAFNMLTLELDDEWSDRIIGSIPNLERFIDNTVNRVKSDKILALIGTNSTAFLSEIIYQVFSTDVAYIKAETLNGLCENIVSSELDEIISSDPKILALDLSTFVDKKGMINFLIDTLSETDIHYIDGSYERRTGKIKGNVVICSNSDEDFDEYIGLYMNDLIEKIHIL